MAEFQQANVYQSVVLVDRACEGDTEIIYDGVRVKFQPGEIEKPVPQFLAEWLFQTGKETVPLVGGGRALRFGIKNPSDELVQALGPECGDCDPIEIDRHRVENWDVENYVSGGRERKVLKVARDPSDFPNLGAGATFGNER